MENKNIGKLEYNIEKLEESFHFIMDEISDEILVKMEGKLTRKVVNIFKKNITDSVTSWNDLKNKLYYIVDLLEEGETNGK